jgi:peptidoglycan/xylan/chitin deacetylase (PgdA/CDA1 family)
MGSALDDPLFRLETGAGLTRALLYHDVVPEGAYDTSGFVSPDANIYKFPVSEFERHLDAIAARHPETAVRVESALIQPDCLILTFDDGGASALPTADILERRGHAGHFFITTGYIGTPGFLARGQIAELARRGHVIGSHSCSHPALMARLPASEIEREWRQSIDTLSGIVGSEVTAASVPGGSYRRAVAAAAARAGIRMLFTSEPTSAIYRVDGCAVLGRYSIQRGTSSELAAALAAGDPLPRYRQAVYWNFKKVLKWAGGTAWIAFRRAVLAKRSS